MSTIKAAALLELVESALVAQGVPEGDAPSIAEEFVVAEYLGRRTHGVGKVVALNAGNPSAVPTEHRTGAVASVDGGGGNGFILMRRLAEQAARMADEHGVGVVTARNFSRFSGLHPYTGIIARRGHIGVLVCAAGPAAVAPHGSVDPITGTNPVAFSFPVGDEVQTIDFSSSELVWGAIRQAMLEGRPLPAGPFLDADGAATTDPRSVNAVRAFGGAKGWALNLAVELLSAAAGGLVGTRAATEFDLGAVLIALDPVAMGGGPQFAEAARALLAEIRDARPDGGSDNGSGGVRAPGDRLRLDGDLDRILADPAPLEVPETTLERLRRLAAGDVLDDLASDPLFN